MTSRVVKAISEIANILIAESVNLPSLSVIEFTDTVSYKKRDPETFVLLLSDLQVGIKTSTYNFKVFRRRMKNLVENIVRVVKLHRRSHPVENLVVFLMGDLVQNENILHFVDLDELEGVIREQLFGNAIPALKDFFVKMLQIFESIEVVCVHGNHGSFGRMYAKSTNLDDIAYYFLKEMFRDNPRISFKLTEKFYNTYDLYGWRFLIVHGDTIKMHLNLPWYGVTTRLMRWQGSIGDFDYLCMGHFHNATMLDWNGKTIFINGTFLSDDEWTMQRLGLSSSVCQLLLGVHPKRGVSFVRKIWLENGHSKKGGSV